MSGEVGVLNVGAGDVKLSFDRNNLAERIRAARIVRDMLRRGYALLIEVVQPDGSKAYQRALDFDENHCEYIIADYAPLKIASADEEASEAPADSAPAASAAPPAGGKVRRTRRVDAATTRAVSVPRTAGG